MSTTFGYAMRGLRLLTQWLLFPLAITATALLLHAAPRLGIELIHAQMGTFAAIILVVAAGERWFPAVKTWRLPVDGDTRTDTTSFIVLMAFGDPLTKFLAATMLAAVIEWLEQPRALGLFPENWPFFLQLGLAAVVAELGQYAMHRLAHQWLPLWRVHAAHHSARRIYWLNGFRVHPLNMSWHYLVGTFPLLLLGASDHVLITYASISAVAAVLQHANIDLRYGVLNYIFSTNELHRWHHSNRREEGNSNYGGVLIIWDIVFGTYRNRKGMPTTLGLFHANGYPVNSYIKQLLLPFSRRWRPGAASDPAEPSCCGERTNCC